jgi:hypothetical protein
VTDQELFNINEFVNHRVQVNGSDYQYEGHIVAVFLKINSKVRCVVEDSCGRLFIHNASQVARVVK